MFIVMSVLAGGRSPQGVLGTGTQNVAIVLAEGIRLSHFDFTLAFAIQQRKIAQYLSSAAEDPNRCVDFPALLRVTTTALLLFSTLQ